MHEVAREACSTLSAATIVEVGSFHGRSTISLAFGVQAGGTGCVFAIDPHRRQENYEQFLRNVKAAGVDHLVEPVRTFSSEAVTSFADGTVDVLFLDGAHDYGSVYQDIKNWSPKLSQRAVIAFNDVVWWKGVQGAIRDTIARGRSDFRDPRWVFNTLLFDHRPSEPWTVRDSFRLARLKCFLVVAGAWTRFHKRLTGRRSDLPAKVDLRVMNRTLRVLLPAT